VCVDCRAHRKVLKIPHDIFGFNIFKLSQCFCILAGEFAARVRRRPPPSRDLENFQCELGHGIVTLNDQTSDNLKKNQQQQQIFKENCGKYIEKYIEKQEKLVRRIISIFRYYSID
jgi:hypothetical protein